MAPLKGSVRALEKARDDYDKRVDGPGLSWLFDMVRGSVICEQPEEVERVIDYLVKRGCVVRLKNRFATPTPGGFRDFNLNIRVTVPSARGGPSVNHICELQVHVKALKEFGKEIGSHDVYDFFRKYFCGGTEAVEERLRLMDAVFGERAVGGVAGGLRAPEQRATSLKEVVEQVCKEGDVKRMEAAAKLVTTMCEHDLAEKINRALLDRRCRGGVYDSWDALGTTSKLAMAKYEQGKLDESLELFQKALAGYTREAGLDHKSTVEAMNNVGNLLQVMEKSKEALEMYEKALAGKTRVFGPEHTSTLDTMNNIGNVLAAMGGKNKEALEMYEKVLAGYKRAVGLDHSSTLTTINNIGAVLLDMGKDTEALEMYRKALAGKTRVFGPDHTSTLDTMHNIGNLMRRWGKHTEALEIYEKALAGYNRALGSDHTSTLDTMFDIGLLLESQGKFEEASTMVVKVVAGFMRTVGPEHSNTIQAMQLHARLRSRNKLYK